MNTFKTYLQSKGFSKVTVERYQYDTLRFISHLDKENTSLETTRLPDLMHYLQTLQKQGASNRTRAGALTSIRHFFDYQIALEKRIDNPAKHLKIKGIKRETLYQLFTPIELETLLASYKMPSEADKIKNNWWYGKYCNSRKRDRIALSLMIYQGLSSYDINRLELKAVDLHKGTIKLHEGRKSAARELEVKSHQIIPLMEYTTRIRAEILALRLSKGKEKKLDPVVNGVEPSNALFPCSTTRQNNVNLFKRITKELKENNPKFTDLHQIRNSVITNWLKQYNLRKVQYMAGHKHIHSTESYQVNLLDDLQMDIDQFHPMG